MGYVIHTSCKVSLACWEIKDFRHPENFMNFHDLNQVRPSHFVRSLTNFKNIIK